MRLINLETEEKFEAVIEKLTQTELKKMKGSQSFTFDWSLELNNEVYQIRQKGKKTRLGLISLIDYPHELRVHINLIESRKDQRGKNKKTGNIPGCLIAHACIESFKKGYGGFVSLVSKTQLIPYYEKYGFVEVGTHMAVFAQESKTLISKYFGDEEI